MGTTSFHDTVFETTEQIEHLLAHLYGQAGTERVSDVLDENEIRELEFIAMVRYSLVDGVKIKGGEERFIRTCEWLIKRLETRIQAVSTSSFSTGPECSRHFLENSYRQANRFILFGGGTVCVLLFRIYWTQTVEHGDWSHRTVEILTDAFLAAFAASLSTTITFYTSGVFRRRR